jgi:S-adenosylmethionine synthetase
LSQSPRHQLTSIASGLLGREVQKQFALDGWNAVGTGLSRISPPEVIKLDILDANDIHRVLADVEPHVVVHCAANRFPDSCTADPIAARKINVDASRALAEATTARGIFLIYISTDYVFSGRPGEAPYQPASTPNPPNVYVSPQSSDFQLCRYLQINPTIG